MKKDFMSQTEAIQFAMPAVIQFLARDAGGWHQSAERRESWHLHLSVPNPTNSLEVFERILQNLCEAIEAFQGGPYRLWYGLVLPALRFCDPEYYQDTSLNRVEADVYNSGDHRLRGSFALLWDDPEEGGEVLRLTFEGSAATLEWDAESTEGILLPRKSLNGLSGVSYGLSGESPFDPDLVGDFGKGFPLETKLPKGLG
jgi:hypothetical protein